MLKREFTIKSQVESELLTLDLEFLDKMRVEFSEEFEFLFESGFKRLNRSLKIKLAAIRYCKEFMRKEEEIVSDN